VFGLTYSFAINKTKGTGTNYTVYVAVSVIYMIYKTYIDKWIGKPTEIYVQGILPKSKKDHGKS
jgi:hypothetical protein